LLLTFLFSSCLPLLHADFENLPVGKNPPSDLPGPPDGDVLRYSRGAGPVEPLLVSRLDLRGERALSFRPVHSGRSILRL
jgi:hypothetical protein